MELSMLLCTLNSLAIELEAKVTPCISHIRQYGYSWMRFRSADWKYQFTVPSVLRVTSVSWNWIKSSLWTRSWSKCMQQFGGRVGNWFGRSGFNCEDFYLVFWCPFTMGTGWFPGVRQPGCGLNYPLPSRADFEERVELYLYSYCGPSWQVVGWTFIVHFSIQQMNSMILLFVKNIVEELKKCQLTLESEIYLTSI